MARVIPPEEIGNPSLAGRRVAILGYGNQGRAQALNLRDEGVDLRIGQRAGKGFDQAKGDGMTVTTVREAAEQADVLMFTLPDESAADIYASEVKESAEREPKALLFTHGFNICYGLIQPPPSANVVLVAPKGQARVVRDRYLAGSGAPALIAVHQDADGQAREIAFGYAKAAGYTRSVLFETTFQEETETDLFGEQAVLCGGIIGLMGAAYKTMVDAGYSPEIAYFECVQETKLIVDLIAERGIAGMRLGISDTAEWGGYLAGRRIVTEDTRRTLESLLAEIRSGEFARNWVDEARAGKPRLRAFREAGAQDPIETVGEALRAKINR